MAFINACTERESLGGGRYRSVIYAKPVAYLSGGTYWRSDHNWATGDAAYPHVVTAAPMMVYTASDGMRRICPTGGAVCPPGRSISRSASAPI